MQFNNNIDKMYIMKLRVIHKSLPHLINLLICLNMIVWYVKKIYSDSILYENKKVFAFHYMCLLFYYRI